jgi:hypothetical protein
MERRSTTPAAEAIELAACRVFKAIDERRYTLGLCYPALKADAGTAADGHRDFAGAPALRDAAWEWMTKSRSIGLGHAADTQNAGTVVESYLWPSETPWVVKATDGSEQRVEKDDWLLGVVWREDVWPLVKSGQLTGYSFQGGARRAKPTAERLAQLRSA